MSRQAVGRLSEDASPYLRGAGEGGANRPGERFQDLDLAGGAAQRDASPYRHSFKLFGG